MTHELSLKRVEYPSGQWRGTCSCGWETTADADTDQQAIDMIERAHSEHQEEVEQ